MLMVLCAKCMTWVQKSQLWESEESQKNMLALTHGTDYAVSSLHNIKCVYMHARKLNSRNRSKA